MAKVTNIDSPTPGRVGRRSQALVQRMNEKAPLAFEMRLEGKQPSEIAEVLGFKHVNDVYRMLEEQFDQDAAFLTDAQRKTMMAWELMRLDKLQAAVWPAAMMGDPKSVDSAVRIVMARAKIAGLDQVDPVVQKNLVLVMGEKEDEYIASLKAASDD